MDQTVLSRYQIEFQNTTFHISGFPKKIRKSLVTNNWVLTEFIDFWHRISDIDDYLIPELVNDNDAGSETIAILINDEIAYFYNTLKEDISEPDYMMPLNDLIEVVNSWKAFLAEPPLNGSLV
ncbi:hypothetical protein [Mucilaginibacter myungsuensis]|uniref:Uncharacterized protein n=1 Tax=Mucilaginibacter myungsuensis TaxID=649104 RepID=A0A929L058_9SPHI|nr:hypothetical protein [Mucilaginibacter myungsuensis]MBE9661740.1 hypothetical protein [Mucilaginibacter myungsuensis]MDN3599828.1 hypothetical protein [Mucilaginibacter myungsuensis]